MQSAATSGVILWPVTAATKTLTAAKTALAQASLARVKARAALSEDILARGAWAAPRAPPPMRAADSAGRTGGGGGGGGAAAAGGGGGTAPVPLPSRVAATAGASGGHLGWREPATITEGQPKGEEAAAAKAAWLAKRRPGPSWRAGEGERAVAGGSLLQRLETERSNAVHAQRR